jgi:gamma-glutamyltranspeptidase / glutathione hydrolase
MAEARWVPATTRPVIMGTRHMVSAGHSLAALGGLRILESGGNAFDAGVATGLCINVVQADLTNIGGVAPICLYRADRGEVETISGLGWWPKAADPAFFHRHHGGRMPPGIHRCVMPAAIDAWLTALERHGSMTFAQVAEPAIELAEEGFPMHSLMFETLSEPSALASMRSWPSTSAVFLRDGAPIPIGEPVVQRELAGTLRMLVDAERGAASREEGIRAARDRFYRGAIAEAMVRFSTELGGWFTREDLAEFQVGVEPALTTSYRGYDIYACGPWCQGPVVLQAMNILEGYDLARVDPHGAEKAHLVLESLKAAFADRDRYYGDPRFVDVPLDGLLSREYAEAWRGRIDRARACPAMPEPGDAWRFSLADRPKPGPGRPPTATTGAVEPDTSYLCVVDDEGNAFSATPSDGVVGTPLVPGHGFIMSGRGVQSWLDPDHPSSLAPGKRPRLTPNPGMVLKDGRLVMPYGTPGLDVQPQAMVQFLLNVIDYGMNVQEAVEAPRCATYSFPASSDPHPYSPGVSAIERRAGQTVIDRLRDMGHDLTVWPDWAGTAGSLGAILVDHAHGVRSGAADPRRVAYAVGR